MVLADELAKKQRSISVAEFFEKNKHMLGFDSPTRGIITTVKEAIDNSLDACEEAEVLPDILVSVRRLGSDVFRVTVEDNGPGIDPRPAGNRNLGSGAVRTAHHRQTDHGHLPHQCKDPCPQDDSGH